MSEQKDGLKAFPFTYEDKTTPGVVHTYVYEGMTLYDYFAAKALNGILASCPDGLRVQDIPDSTIEAWVITSRRIADAMLKARSL